MIETNENRCSTHPNTRVVKLGGSLLSLSDLKHRLESWEIQTSSLSEPSSKLLNVWIVGGGQSVDALRTRQTIENLSDEECHWAAISMMSANAQWFASEFGWPLIDNLKAIGATNGKTQTQGMANNVVFNPKVWLRKEDTHSPRDWSVTSDSIAAMLARRIGADELLLLKSRNALRESVELNLEVADVSVLQTADPYYCSAQVKAWVANELVDRFFPIASRGLKKIRTVNLRVDHWLTNS